MTLFKVQREPSKLFWLLSTPLKKSFSSLKLRHFKKTEQKQTNDVIIVKILVFNAHNMPHKCLNILSN